MSQWSKMWTYQACQNLLSEIVLRKREFSEMDRDPENSDLEYTKEKLKEKYDKAALNPRGLFPYPVGRDGLKDLDYDMDLVNRLDPEITRFFCGVGNPFSLGKIRLGDRVLDIGCGAGVDTFIAALMAGPDGRAVGIEIVESMYERACSNLRLTGLMNVRFFHGSAESLPFKENSFDIIISNGVFTLIMNKEQGLKEAIRVLKPGGRFMISDQVQKDVYSFDMKDRGDLKGGTIPGMDFLVMMKKTGFTEVEAIEKRGFESSAETAAMYFRGKKPCEKTFSELDHRRRGC